MNNVTRQILLGVGVVVVVLLAVFSATIVEGVQPAPVTMFHSDVGMSYAPVASSMAVRNCWDISWQGCVEDGNICTDCCELSTCSDAAMESEQSCVGCCLTVYGPPKTPAFKACAQHCYAERVAMQCSCCFLWQTCSGLGDSCFDIAYINGGPCCDDGEDKCTPEMTCPHPG